MASASADGIASGLGMIPPLPSLMPSSVVTMAYSTCESSSSRLLLPVRQRAAAVPSARGWRNCSVTRRRLAGTEGEASPALGGQPLSNC
jgi:hypothetical protein